MHQTFSHDSAPMRERILYEVLKQAVRVGGCLPRSVSGLLADALGFVWYRLDARHRRVTRENIVQAFGADMTRSRADRMALQVFRHIARIPFEVAWSVRLTRDQFLSYFTITGTEHVTAAHARGRGVLVVTCHLGNFELLIPAIDETGFTGYAIYRKLDFAPLERLIREIRQRFGVTMIPLRGASRKLDEILAAGGVVGTLLDQSVDWYKGVFVTFFGRPACTNRGLAVLALRTRAPVVPMYITRESKRFHIRFLPELPRVETGDPIHDVEANTQNYTAAIESMIRQCPDQYFWVHNRWKTRNYCPWPPKG